MEQLETLKEKIKQAEDAGNVMVQAELLEQAVAIAREQYGVGSNCHIELQSEYGGLLKYIGRPKEAVEQLLEVKELLETRGDIPNYTTALVNLAGAYRFVGDLEKSEALYLEARELSDKKDYVYASICNNLGILYQDQGEWEKAEELHLESKELLWDEPGCDGEYMATLGNLAAVYLARKKYGESEELLGEAEERVRAAGLTDQVLYASILNQKATLYYRMGKLSKALAFFRQAYEICEEKLGKSSEACVDIGRHLS